jgi:hypothetical protein
LCEVLIYQDAGVVELLFHLGSVVSPELLDRLKIGSTEFMVIILRCIYNLLRPSLQGLLTHEGRIAQRVGHLAAQCSKSVERLQH